MSEIQSLCAIGKKCMVWNHIATSTTTNIGLSSVWKSCLAELGNSRWGQGDAYISRHAIFLLECLTQLSLLKL